MEMKQEMISPERAEKYLNSNKANRKLRAGVFEKYQADMEDGKRTDCPVPISFYENGDIADGQHRLWAVLESGIPIKFWVCRGVKKEAGLNIDIGLPRTLVDNARISGVDDNLSNELIALVTFYVFGTRQRKPLSFSKRMELITAHREPCDWAIRCGLKGRGFRNAVVLAAIARAHHHGMEEERLREFSRVLSNGMSNGTEDSAAIALRNYVIARNFNAAGMDGADFFLRAQNAIAYFMKRKSLMVVRVATVEAFPLKKGKK